MEKSVTALLGELLDSYNRVGGINNIDGLNLPSKGAVAQICEDLLQILFPGFHDEEPIASKRFTRTNGRKKLFCILWNNSRGYENCCGLMWKQHSKGIRQVRALRR